MTIENLIAGLELMRANGAKGHCISAEHDVLYVGHGETPVPLEVREQLLGLGWHWDREVDSWAVFT